MIRFYIILLFVLVAPVNLSSQENDSISLAAPFDFPLLLSGNFGELRSNHFHAGLDFKTQGVVGKPIRVPADGYISRASVAAGGYGRAVYVTHNNGYITVYGHLEAFPDSVASRIRAKQYAEETFAVDINFEPCEFPVKRGEVLALAGNSGYSFGPHLHFEVRAADGKEMINPIRFYSSRLTDTRPPRAHSIALTPYPCGGVVNGLHATLTRKLSGAQLRDTINAWGTIGLSVKANDYMDGTNNTYGVYSIEVIVDDSLRFSSKMDGYARSETRLINAWVDYDRYSKKGEWYQNTFILENNPLRILAADKNRGWMTIDEERVYNVELLLSDYHGNTSRYEFNIQGVRDSIPAIETIDAHYLYWFLNNEISYPGMRLSVPRGQLFENAILAVEEDSAAAGVSRRYNIGNRMYPMRGSARISLQVLDTLNAVPDEKYYVRRVTGKGSSNVGGEYCDGWVSANISQTGCYELAIDTIAPSLRPIDERRWARRGVITFSMGDKGRGIKSFKGLIDGVFVLFEYSSKSGRLTCNLRREKIRRGVHTLQLTATDNAGNTTTVEKKIKY